MDFVSNIIVNMPGNCEAVGCTNHSMMDPENKPSFHRFPKESKDPARRKQWIVAMKKLRRDGSQWEPSPTSRVCGRHFICGKIIFFIFVTFYCQVNHQHDQ